MSTLAKKHQLLNKGHFGGRPHRSSQDALVHLVSWIKQQWSAGRKVAGIFADVKSAFPLVHHDRMLHTLKKLQYHPETTNLVFTFLSERTTMLAFNGFKSEDFDLTHGLPQGSPLSPLLYLLYNNSLLPVPDFHPNSTALGFVDDVVLLTSAPNYHQLHVNMQKISHGQIHWARKHGAIFDVQKSKWMIFTPRDEVTKINIDFGERKALQPVKETKWLGVTIDHNLKFKKHKAKTIAKGLKRADFLSSLSNTRWGISPNLFRILIMATVHGPTNYGAVAWLQLPISIDFGLKLK